MRFHALLALAAASTACAPATPIGAVGDRSDAVISGEPAPGLDGVVALMTRSSLNDFDLRCSGTALSSRAVLTAKHCVFEDNGTRFWDEADADSMYVAVGSQVNSDDGRRDIVQGLQVFTTDGPFDRFRFGADGDDIAVLILREEILVETFEAAPLPPEVGDTITIAGYGRRIPGSPVPGDGGIKRQGTATVLDVFDGVMLSEGDSWICQGDSGGPAFNAEMQVVGVNSFGFDPRCEDDIGGFALVPAQAALIAEALAFEPPCFPRAEDCDGKDNDCNGIADEGCYDLGDPCEVAVQCRSDRCEAVGDELRCTDDCAPGGDLCGEGLRCEGDSCGAGRCVPAAPGPVADGEGCTADADCAIGRCAEVEGERRCARACVDEGVPCPGGQVCSTADGLCGSCVGEGIATGLRTFGDSCADAAQCGSGSCVEGICSRPCDAEAPCGLGTHCRDGQCVDGFLGRRGDRCVNAQDCGPDAPLCVQDGESLCADECETSSSCGRGFLCQEIDDVQVCLPEGVPLGAACEAGDACRSGLCEDETCTAMCEQPWDCPVGFACDEARCRPERSGGCSVRPVGSMTRRGRGTAPAALLMLLVLLALRPRVSRR
ncbi:MAG: trypsin-like serine protease [Sandaracinaceae bacterium]